MQLQALTQHVHSLIPYPYNKIDPSNNNNIRTEIQVPIDNDYFSIQFDTYINNDAFILEIGFGGYHPSWHIFILELNDPTTWDNFWQSLTNFIQHLPETIKEEYAEMLDRYKKSDDIRHSLTHTKIIQNYNP